LIILPPPLGKSDHSIFSLKLNCYSKINTYSKLKIYYEKVVCLNKKGTK